MNDVATRREDAEIPYADIHATRRSDVEFGMKFSHSLVVASKDIDEQGHVNNVVFLQWVQDVAVAHWLSLTNKEERERYSWVAVRHEIDYKKQAFENEEITATTWIGKWTAVTCERFTEIRRGDDLLVKGRTIWCMIDRVTTRPTRISSELKLTWLTRSRKKER